MLQLRVFYAMADARTPTLIMVIITAVKVPLAYLCPVLLPTDQVVLGLAAVNAFGFVVGLVVGNLWLRRRLGKLDNRRVLRTVMLTGLASVVAVLTAVVVVTVLERLLGGGTGAVARAWLTVTVGGGVSLVVLAVAMRLLQGPRARPRGVPPAPPRRALNRSTAAGLPDREGCRAAGPVPRRDGDRPVVSAPCPDDRPTGAVGGRAVRR